MRSVDITGAEIQYFRLDPRYWPAVLDRFVDTGLRCVTTYVQWSTHLVGPPDAAHPAGVLDFEGRTAPRLNLKRFLDLVEERDLLLNFRCGPFCCNEMVHGGYPPWLVLGDPAMMVWDWQNRTAQGYWIGRREGSQPSYLHPVYLDWCARWFAAVDPLLRDHLHANGGCVTMVNLDNEVSYIVQDSFLGADYNPVNVAPGGYWHQFLGRKYRRPSDLPYGRRYRSFEAVEPPRAVPETVGDELAWYLDWADFKTWAMAEYLRRLRALHEANGVRNVTFMTNFNPHRPEAIPTRLPAFEAATGGLVGYDFYRGTFLSYSGYHSLARVLKLLNASVGYTWSAEFMAGTWNKVLGTRVSDDHMRFMARCALAHGCKAIAWFMFHDRDCWGDAPVSSHAHARPSLAVLAETHRLLTDALDTWDTLAPLGDVAVLYSLAQHQHTHLGDPQPCADNDLHVGAPRIDGVDAGLATREYEGLFRLVEQAGAQADAVDLVHDATRLARYRLVFLPGSPLLERAAAEALTEYVAEGGTLVVSGPLPTRDERGAPLELACALVHEPYLAQAEPEQEELLSVARVGALLDQAGVEPWVRCRPVSPVSWVDWRATGGGHQEYRQPRNLGSAILHGGPGERVLFVLNHYPEAVEFELELREKGWSCLLDLDSGELLELVKDRARVDVDRKSARIFRLA